MVVPDISKVHTDVTEEISNKEVVSAGNDFDQPMQLNSDSTDNCKKVSLKKFSGDTSPPTAKSGASNAAETFTRMPALSFINNSFFTNLLRSKEQEETPVINCENTKMDKMRSRKLYRQMNKQNEIILSEHINGYCGDKSIADIVEYIEGVKTTGKKKPRKGKNGVNETKDAGKKTNVNFKLKEVRDKKKTIDDGKIITDKTISDDSKTASNVKSDQQEKPKIKNLKTDHQSNDILKDDKSSSPKIGDIKPLANKIEQDKSKPKVENKTSKQNKPKSNGSSPSSLKPDEKRKVPEEKHNFSNVKKNKTDQNKENVVKRTEPVHKNSKTKKK